MVRRQAKAFLHDPVEPELIDEGEAPAGLQFLRIDGQDDLGRHMPAADETVQLVPTQPMFDDHGAVQRHRLEQRLFGPGPRMAVVARDPQQIEQPCGRS